MADGSIPSTRWRPNPGPQTALLRSSATEALFGGQAGGGKTDALLAAATRHVDNAGYRAVIFRRTEKELRQPKGLLERAWSLYGGTGATPKNGGLTWLWPSGARIDLSGMEHEKDRLKWKSAELQFVGWDELTSFTRLQYVYMFSRLRSTAGIHPRVRAASNPGGIGHEWVLERFAPWLYPEDNPDFEGPRAGDGVKLWFRFDEERQEHVIYDHPIAGGISRTFIRSGLADTPQLAGTGYEDRLNELDPLERARLKHGDWMARPRAGTMFRREWFTEELGTLLRSYQDKPVKPPVRIRYWDRAATPLTGSNDPAATVSLLLSMDWDANLYVEHGTQLFARPKGVKDAVRALAEEDAAEFGIGGVVQVLEQDPGQAGVGEIEDFAFLLQGLAFHAVRPSGDKVERARPVSAQCESKRVRVVRNTTWNRPFFDDLEGFPVAKRKDFVDALSGGYLECLRRLAETPRPEPQRPRPPTRETARFTGGY